MKARRIATWSAWASIASALILTGCASEPRSTEPTYALAIGHFVRVKSVGYPDDNEVHVGTVFEVAVAVDLVLAGRMDKTRIKDSFGDASVDRRFDGPYYFVLVRHWNGETGISAFSPARDGFCLTDNTDYSAAFPGVFARLRREDPCNAE
jgi:hypothetical protein